MADLVNYLVNRAIKQAKPSGYYNLFEFTEDLEPKFFK